MCRLTKDKRFQVFDNENIYTFGYYETDLKVAVEGLKKKLDLYFFITKEGKLDKQVILKTIDEFFPINKEGGGVE